MVEAMGVLTETGNRSPSGMVIEVSASRIKVGFFVHQGDELSNNSGSEFGDLVVVELDKCHIIGQVVDVRLEGGRSVIVDGVEYRINRVGEIRLLCTVDILSERVHIGIEVYPHIADLFFPAPSSVLQILAEGSKKTKSEVLLSLGNMRDASGPPLALPPERLFTCHAAVLGTTGAGKSWTLARLVEQCAKFQSKVILFDPSGEFAGLNHNTRHLHFGAAEAGDIVSLPVALPHHHLTESDLFAIFRPSGPSQGPMLRAAVRSLKLARLSPQIAPGGVIPKAYRAKKQYLSEYQLYADQVESPWAKFDIRCLTAQIENECVNPQSSPTEPLVWGGVNPVDQANCMPLISRISDIINNPGLAPIFKPGKIPSLVEKIDEFIVDGDARVLCVSLKNLSFANNAREVILNAVGRRLYDLARAERFVHIPTLVVLDEAHQFLSQATESELNFSATNSFALIAKEGRKYGLTMCLATQRPRDIPEGVLSQMGTLIIHRLINDHDLQVVERASGELDRFSAARIPVLSPGEAIIVGVEFPVALHVKVAAPECRPSFKGADYQQYWKKT